ncbi:MAG: hypothetical protein R6U64_05130 [Bacteroidales bacterium]
MERETWRDTHFKPLFHGAKTSGTTPPPIAERLKKCILSGCDGVFLQAINPAIGYWLQAVGYWLLAFGKNH